MRIGSGGIGSGIPRAEPERRERRERELDRIGLSMPRDGLGQNAAGIAHVAATVEPAVGVHQLHIVAGTRHAHAIAAPHDRGEVAYAEDEVGPILRFAKDRTDLILCVCNFTPVVRRGYRVGVPRPGYYVELVNTDSGFYGGSDVGNAGGVLAEPIPWHGQPYSVQLTLPALAALWLRPRDA